MANNLLATIGAAIPIAIPVLASIAVVGVGISIFNRVRRGRSY